jgi:hypothetical protein
MVVSFKSLRQRFAVSVKSEFLAVAFGMLLILVTFGDGHTSSSIGNLDTIFGHYWWPKLDVFYLLASIGVFLLYGKIKGGLKINAISVAAFTVFLVVLTLVSIDDITTVLGFSSLATYFSGDASRSYWLIVLWVYPIFSYVAFLLFGAANQERIREVKHEAFPLS